MAFLSAGLLDPVTKRSQTILLYNNIIEKQALYDRTMCMNFVTYTVIRSSHNAVHFFSGMHEEMSICPN